VPAGPAAFEEESSERYEYIPTQVTVIEDVCIEVHVRLHDEDDDEARQSIQNSTAGSILPAQVIVWPRWPTTCLWTSKRRSSSATVRRSPGKIMGGWLAQCADLLKPLYGSLKQYVPVQGDRDGLHQLDGKLPFARIVRIWPSYGDEAHPVVALTTTRRQGAPGRRADPQPGGHLAACAADDRGAGEVAVRLRAP
jgi:hypothetical protein